MGFQLVMTGFLFPPFVICRSEFVGAGGVRVEDRGQQHDQFTAAVAVPVGHVVLDHPDHVDDQAPLVVDRVIDVVRSCPALAAARIASRRPGLRISGSIRR